MSERDIDIDERNAGAVGMAQQLLSDDGSGVMGPGPCADAQAEWRRMTAALSTAERELGANTLSADNLKWRSRIDALREFFRDSAYAAEQELRRRGAPSEDHFVRQQRSYLAWLDELRDIFFARVPSGGEEGR